MSDGLIPTLDGVRVLLASEDASGHRRYVHEDGTDVDPARAGDIQFAAALSSSSHEGEPSPAWWSALEISAPKAALLFADEADIEGDRDDVDAEVASWLMRVGEVRRPAASVELDPGFFHTSLQAWLGEGETPNVTAAWDYSFWKAELLPIDLDDDTVPQGATVYEAKVWLGEHSPPDQIRYFISEPGAEPKPRESGWLTSPPDLLQGAAEDVEASVVPCDADAVFGD